MKPLKGKLWMLIGTAILCISTPPLVALQTEHNPRSAASFGIIGESSAMHPDGTAMSYQTFGNSCKTSTPLVLVHGRGSNGSQFWEVAETMAQENRCIITVDLPGHGGLTASDLNNLPQWKISTLAEYTNWLISDHLGHERVDLFGHSLGGVIAMEYIAKYPNEVSQVVVSGTHLEIESISPNLIWLDRFTRNILGDSVFYTGYQYWMWSGSGEEFQALNTVHYRGGGHDAERDMAIITQIPVYDYRTAIEQFESVGGTFGVVYAEDDGLINSGMGPSLAFMSESPTRSVVNTPGGHYGHLAEPDLLAGPLLELFTK